MSSTIHRHVSDSFKPLIWTHAICGADFTVSRSKTSEWLFFAYKAILVFIVLFLTALNVVLDIAYLEEWRIFQFYQYLRPLYALRYIVGHGTSFKKSFIQFLEALGQIDLKLKLNTNEMYASLKFRCTIVVFILCAWMMWIIWFYNYLAIHKFIPLNYLFFFGDLQILTQIVMIQSVQVRFSLLVRSVQRRRCGVVNDKTTSNSLLGRMLLRQDYYTHWLSGAKLSMSDLLETYQEIVECSTSLNEILHIDMLLSILKNFLWVLWAVDDFTNIYEIESKFFYLGSSILGPMLSVMTLCLVGDRAGATVSTLRLELTRMIALEELNERNRRVAKDLMFLLEVEPVRYTVWYMFPLDLSLALGFVSRLVALTIIMIQVFKLFQ